MTAYSLLHGGHAASRELRNFLYSFGVVNTRVNCARRDIVPLSAYILNCIVTIMKNAALSLSFLLCCGAGALLYTAPAMSASPIDTAAAATRWHCTFLAHGYPRELTTNQAYETRLQAEQVVEALYPTGAVTQLYCRPL